MSQIQILQRQHYEIVEVVKTIKKLIQKNQLAVEANEIAKHINILAGKLTIHLASEDKHLYPNLKNSNDSKIKNLTKAYIDEMGNISETFMIYKNKYNIKSKILNNQSEFIKDTNEIFKVLENRIFKEDNELYPLLK